MLGNIFQNGVLLITLLIVDILAVSNGAESKPPNNNKPICVIPKETVPEFALFEKKTG
jgi:hypothetical protein